MVQVGEDVADGGGLAHRVLRGRRTYRPSAVLVDGFAQVRDGGGIPDRIYLPMARYLQRRIDIESALGGRRRRRAHRTRRIRGSLSFDAVLVVV